MTTESPDPGNPKSFWRRLLAVGSVLLAIGGGAFTALKGTGEVAKAFVSVWEAAKSIGVVPSAQAPAPEKDKLGSKDKDVITGSIPPRAQPAPAAPCIPERTPDDVIGTLYNYIDQQAVFAQLYRARRVCSPGWQLTVESLPQKQEDGTWRIKLSSGNFGVWVVVDTRAEIGFLRPYDRVRVEGTVINFQPTKLFKAGAVHIGSGRISKL